MAEDATKKSVAINDLKVVIDDIYSRLNRMATKKYLIKTLNVIRKGCSDIENSLPDKANECDVYSKYEADTKFVTISDLVSHLVQKHKNNCSRCSQMLGRGGRRSGGYAN